MAKRAVAAAAAVWLAVVVAACQQQPRAQADLAAPGAPPAVHTPVGPVPGPQAARPETPNPYANDPVALEEGRRLFVRFNCSGCHGGHAGGGMGPSLRDVDWMYGSKPSDVFDSIAEGRAHGMPAWGTMIPQEQIWKLTAYVGSLRTEREPNPPR